MFGSGGRRQQRASNLGCSFSALVSSCRCLATSRLEQSGMVCLPKMLGIPAAPLILRTRRHGDLRGKTYRNPVFPPNAKVTIEYGMAINVQRSNTDVWRERGSLALQSDRLQVPPPRLPMHGQQHASVTRSPPTNHRAYLTLSHIYGPRLKSRIEQVAPGSPPATNSPCHLEQKYAGLVEVIARLR